jgi:GH15 family glucan-1,4-alpha-glucosidase
MAWVAVDRAVRSVEEFGLDGPVDKWRTMRDAIHAEVLEKGYNSEVGSFTQYYGSDALDASLLMIPLFGFLPATDPRVKQTIERIEKDLTEDGFVLRYRAEEASDVDGLTGREGAFLACSFWMADCLSMIGRTDDARALFERLLGLRNDLGLLSEEYDSVSQRQVGNFPQAFSHVSLVNTACNLSGQSLDEVLPSPETVQELRRSILRRDRGLSRSHGFFTPQKHPRAKQADGATGEHAATNNRRSDG